MSELTIKINILGREYPIKVTVEEEDKYKEANLLVEEKVKLFRDTFKINDNQDGLIGRLATVLRTLPKTGEVVVHCVQDNTPWIYYTHQLTLLSEVQK